MRVVLSCFIFSGLVCSTADTVFGQNTERSEPTFELNCESAELQGVLERLCTNAKLRLEVHGTIPTRSFSYKSEKAVPLGETISVLNRELLRDGCLLVVDKNYLVLWDTNTEKRFDFVPRVSPEDLHSLGEHQLRTVSFKLERSDPSQLIEDIELITQANRFSSVIPLRSVNRVEVTSLVGTLRRIVTLIDEAEGRDQRRPPVEARTNRTRGRSEAVLPHGGTVVMQLQRDPVQKMLGISRDQATEITASVSKGKLSSNDYREFLAEMRNLSADERAEKRAAFVERSGKLKKEASVQAFEVLSDAQKKAFAEWYVRGQPGTALGLPFIVEQLELSESQLGQLRTLLKKQATALEDAADRSERMKLSREHTAQFAEMLKELQQGAERSE